MMCGSRRPLERRDAGARTSARRPAALDRLLLVERGGQAVPGDDRGDRVDALVQRGGGRARCRPRRRRRSCRRAGRPALSSCASGCWASQSISAMTSRRLGVGRVDGDGAARVAEPAAVPREDVEAGLAQRADADVAGRLVARRVRVRSAREPPQPWPCRIVGAFAAARRRDGRRARSACRRRR